MLVLSRKNQEAIVINGEITVRILGIRGNTVRLGIEAPQEVPIRRSELCDHSSELCASGGDVYTSSSEFHASSGELAQVGQPCAA